MIEYITSIFVLLIGICNASYASSSYGGGSDGGSYGALNAAIRSKHLIQTIPVSGSRSRFRSPVINIDGESLPLTLRFNSHSSRINAIQRHIGQAGQVKKESTIEQPHLLIQNIKKPVIQEVREVIVPYRRITQEIRPVRERIKTIIAQEQGPGHGYGYGYHRTVGRVRHRGVSKKIPMY